MSQPSVLRIFVASPSDVLDAREVLKEVVEDLNNTWGQKTGLLLQYLDWRKHVTPWLGKPPEPTILQQLPVESWDLFIGIMWSRLGTPTGDVDPATHEFYKSGTEEEFTLAYKCNQQRGTPKILFYRCMQPVKPDVDPDQLKLVQEFFRQFEQQGQYFGLYTQYDTLDGFRRRIHQHLTNALLDLWFQGSATSDSSVSLVMDGLRPWLAMNPEDKNLEAKLQRYRMYRNEIDNAREYEFEEVLWGEVRDHLHELGDKGYGISFERSQWLRRHNLYAQAEDHFREMLQRYKDKEVAISKSLGFSLLRQGKTREAIIVFEQGRSLIAEEDVEEIADFENLLGQANRAAGRWDKALEHFTRSVRAFILSENRSSIGGVYINRGFLYALLGLYPHAIQECQHAVELLDSLPNSNPLTQRRRMYAQMNLGTAYRYGGEYDAATHHYQKSLEFAQNAGDQEVVCYALQQLGINACLQGRRARHEGRDLIQAVQHQLRAWEHLTQALAIAQEAKWRPALADGLGRLARVYEEISRLTYLQINTEWSAPDYGVALMELQAAALTFQPPTEAEYEDDLILPKRFAQLDWLEKSARLFELSALMADEAHRALNSLSRLAELLLELKRYDVVPTIVLRIERIKAFDYQGSLFSSLSDITLADLDFEQKRFDSALEKYANAYAAVAKHTGYASHVLTCRLKNFDRRIRALPPTIVFRWCDLLQERWLGESLATIRPDMLRLLENVRFDAVVQQRHKSGMVSPQNA